MTENFVKESFRIIEEIDRIGGAVPAIEMGWTQNEITSSAYNYQKKIDTKEKIIVGVNKYENQEEIEPELLKIDTEKVNEQIASIKKLKQTRNNDQVKKQIANLKSAAETDQNVIPVIINCVKNDCTLGEIADTFREVFGEYGNI